MTLAFSSVVFIPYLNSVSWIYTISYCKVSVKDLVEYYDEYKSQLLLECSF